MQLCDKSLCTGCRACAELCPNGCITMQMDREGFLAPVIDPGACTDCGMCASRCPRLNEVPRAGEVQRVYAAKLEDDKVRSACTSGGAFHTLASEVLAAGGVVFGCAFDETVRARHVEVSSIEALKALYGAKYVQSDTEHTYRQAKARLEEGVQVLYSGTPCQIAGLNAYLGKPYENLVTVELLCMGVPSPGLFRAYLNWRGQQLGECVERYAFRVKEGTRWGVSSAQRVNTKSKTKYYASNTDPYVNAFYKAYTLREACYACPFRGKARMGDLTICDYWGIDVQNKAFFSHKGVSGITVNSARGMALMARVAPRLTLLETNFESISAENRVFFRSRRRPPERDRAFRDGISPEMFTKNPVFFPTLFDRVFTWLPDTLKPLAKQLRRALRKKDRPAAK